MDDVAKTCTCVRGKVLMPALATWVPCPKCNGLVVDNKPSINLLDNDLEIKEDEALSAKIEKLHIPSDVLEAGLGDFDFDWHFTSVFRVYSRESSWNLHQTLSGIYNELLHGRTLRSSLLLFEPPMFDTMLYVAYCLKTAVQSNLTAVPFITVNTLGDLLGLEKQNDKYSVVENIRRDRQRAEEAYGVRYSDYVMADLVFLKAASGTQPKGYFALENLLAERSRMSKPTYVWSPFRLDSAQTPRGLEFLLQNKEGRKRLDRLTFINCTKRVKMQAGTYAEANAIDDVDGFA